MSPFNPPPNPVILTLSLPKEDHSIIVTNQLPLSPFNPPPNPVIPPLTLPKGDHGIIVTDRFPLSPFHPPTSPVILSGADHSIIVICAVEGPRRSTLTTTASPFQPLCSNLTQRPPNYASEDAPVSPQSYLSDKCHIASGQAQTDLEEIWHYIAKESASADIADRLIDTIANSVSKTLRPLSRFGSTTLMLFNARRYFQKQRPLKSVTSKAVLLNQHWHGKCNLSI